MQWVSIDGERNYCVRRFYLENVMQKYEDIMNFNRNMDKSCPNYHSERIRVVGEIGMMLGKNIKGMFDKYWESCRIEMVGSSDSMDYADILGDYVDYDALFLSMMFYGNRCKKDKLYLNNGNKWFPASKFPYANKVMYMETLARKKLKCERGLINVEMGDLVFFDVSGTHVCNKVGIVESCSYGNAGVISVDEDGFVEHLDVRDGHPLKDKLIFTAKIGWPVRM